MVLASTLVSEPMALALASKVQALALALMVEVLAFALTLRFWPLTTPCSKKVSCLMFDNNFGKCEPIFKILSPDDS